MPPCGLALSDSRLTSSPLRPSCLHPIILILLAGFLRNIPAPIKYRRHARPLSLAHLVVLNREGQFGNIWLVESRKR